MSKEILYFFLLILILSRQAMQSGSTLFVKVAGLQRVKRYSRTMVSLKITQAMFEFGYTLVHFHFFFYIDIIDVNPL